MAAPKGFRPPAAGKGRRKGTPNKATTDLRQAIAALLEANAPHLQKWIDAVARKRPERAADVIVRLLEFGLPRLSRAEFTDGAGNSLLPPSITISFNSGGLGMGDSIATMVDDEESTSAALPTFNGTHHREGWTDAEYTEKPRDPATDRAPVADAQPVRKHAVVVPWRPGGAGVDHAAIEARRQEERRAAAAAKQAQVEEENRRIREGQAERDRREREGL